jgi:release factor glutamine methyltransferase
MTIHDALREGNSILLYAEVETPALDGTILLAESLGISKETLFASLKENIDGLSYDTYRTYIDRRCAGYPVSYIIRRKEFYGIEFFVDERVLVPRPDTETLVDEVIALANEAESTGSLIDVCTGSGCIAITLKKELPHLDVRATDVSAKALEVFAINSRNILGYEIDAKASDLLDAVESSFDYIVSNPPYIPASEVRDMKRIGWPEPSMALDGGISGREVTERLIVQSARRLNRGGRLLIESDPAHMERLSCVFAREGFADVRVRKDLGGRDRVISGKMR